MAFNHLHLKVKNIKDSLVFYEALFGFKEKARVSDTFIFIKGKNDFDLALEQVASIEKLPKGIHFGMSVNCKEELREQFSKIQNVYPGCLESPELKENEKWMSFIVFDPDGYPIELYWDPFLREQSKII